VRIVLDTNVAFSALLWRGVPYRLLEAIGQRTDVQLVSSAALLEELAEVLTRAAATQRLALLGTTAQALLAQYVEVVQVVTPSEVPRVVPNDVDDDQVIAAAVEGRVQLIVSGDTDLLALGSHQGIEIVNAREALGRVE
jgi:putative PIN family toxin of toxin-antitoxin system